MQPYEARSFHFIDLLSINGWRMKLYGIAWQRDSPRPELVENAKAIAAKQLAAETAPNCKVGFIGVHDGLRRMLCVCRFLGQRERTVSPRFSFALQRSGQVESRGAG